MDHGSSIGPSDRQLTSHLTEMLTFAVAHGASDLHLRVGLPPVVRIDGSLKSVPNETPYTTEAVATDVRSSLSALGTERLAEQRELDFSFGFAEVRLRCNVFVEKGSLVGAYRLIPTVIRTVEQLGLPPVLLEFTNRNQGLFIITGPTGHGKSTTLAALIDHINQTRSENIITIEDPIEYVYKNAKSMIAQREVGSDTRSFAVALRSALRQDPNVLLVGEMRDLETIEAALTLAETGHLVMTTLHTNSAAETADRIIDVFPPHQQPQVRSQLASVLVSVVSQRLIPKVNGGRVAAAEIMTVNTAIANNIREGKTHQLANIIQTSSAEGMVGLDKVLAGLVNRGDITIDEAQFWAHDPKQLKLNVY
ncbi:type IV pilus twitching motility protein PilT [Candidatus Berkelbacteria bacterium]|nr:type IV pilus twitching motility protein PilT [Candidatus Berkelbacteria bacterium]